MSMLISSKIRTFLAKYIDMYRSRGIELDVDYISTALIPIHMVKTLRGSSRIVAIGSGACLLPLIAQISGIEFDIMYIYEDEQDICRAIFSDNFMPNVNMISSLDTEYLTTLKDVEVLVILSTLYKVLDVVKEYIYNNRCLAVVVLRCLLYTTALNTLKNTLRAFNWHIVELPLKEGLLIATK